jgi:tryptophan synthase beta chain
MKDYFKNNPDQKGFFGEYGGSFIPPDLQVEMDKITEGYYTISKSHDFISELRSIRKHFQGRPTPVYYAKELSRMTGGRIYLKREDLNHTGLTSLTTVWVRGYWLSTWVRKSLLPKPVRDSMVWL